MWKYIIPILNLGILIYVFNFMTQGQTLISRFDIGIEVFLIRESRQVLKFALGLSGLSKSISNKFRKFGTRNRDA